MRVREVERLVVAATFFPLQARVAALALQLSQLAHDLRHETSLRSESLRKHAITAQQRVAEVRHWRDDAERTLEHAAENWISRNGVHDGVWEAALDSFAWLGLWLERFQGFVERDLQRDAGVPMKDCDYLLPELTEGQVRDFCSEAGGQVDSLNGDLAYFGEALGRLMILTGGVP